MSARSSTHPDFAEFSEKYDSEASQVVYSTLVADLETPVSAMLKIAAGSQYSFLLESVEGGSVRGRYSIIGLEPDVIWRCHKSTPEINRKALLDTKTFITEPTGALDTKTSSEVMDILIKLAKEQGITIVLVTHEPHIASLAERQIKMSDGNITEDLYTKNNGLVL